MAFEQAFYFSMGICITVFIILYFTYKLSEDHKYFKIVALFVGFFLLLLVPTSFITYEQECYPVVNTSTISGATTAYEYTTYCSSNSGLTNTTFFKGYSLFLNILLAYIAIYFVYFVFTHLNVWSDKMSSEVKRWFKGK